MSNPIVTFSAPSGYFGGVHYAMPDGLISIELVDPIQAAAFAQSLSGETGTGAGDYEVFFTCNEAQVWPSSTATPSYVPSTGVALHVVKRVKSMPVGMSINSDSMKLIHKLAQFLVVAAPTTGDYSATGKYGAGHQFVLAGQRDLRVLGTDAVSANAAAANTTHNAAQVTTASLVSSLATTLVASLNGQSGAVDLIAGTNVTLDTSVAQQIKINATAPLMPTYNESGIAVADTMHCVQVEVTASSTSTTITFSNASVFANTGYGYLINDSTAETMLTAYTTKTTTSFVFPTVNGNIYECTFWGV